MTNSIASFAPVLAVDLSLEVALIGWQLSSSCDHGDVAMFAGDMSFGNDVPTTL